MPSHCRSAQVYAQPSQAARYSCPRMGIPDDVTFAVRTILRAIERADFHVSVHRMIDYVERHAVPCVDPARMLHLARVDGGDGPERVHECAVELARMVDVDL